VNKQISLNFGQINLIFVKILRILLTKKARTGPKTADRFLRVLITLEILKVVIHLRGQKELSFKELFLKMTLAPDSGLPRVP
jgi:hypothetical protein